MQTITTTQLRTKSKDLVKALDEGKQVDLIHRSKIIGEIRPKKYKKIFDAENFLKKASKLNLPILSDEDMEKRYREAMEKKHGKDFSRHKQAR